MAKVIVERPRAYRGHTARGGCKFARKGRRSDNPRNRENNPSCEGMTFRSHWVNSKSLNENLRPLKRYLVSQVGRPWRKVHAEISAHLSVRNAVQKHVFDHLRDIVAVIVEVRDGQVWEANRYGVLHPVITSPRWPSLYVCPKTGLLKQVIHRPNKPYPNLKKLSEDIYLVRKKGQWFRLDIALLPSDYEKRKTCFDAFVRAFIASREFYQRAHDRELPWGPDRYALSMRQISKKEKRAWMT